MAIDWSTKPWWLRPLAAMGTGVVGGLVLTALMAFLSYAGDVILIVTVLTASFVYAIWSLFDVRRLQREMAVKMAEWERLEASFRTDDR